MNNLTNSYSGLPRAASPRWKLFSALLFGLGLAAQAAFGQQVVTGTVTNAATGRTLEGAVVSVQGRQALTDRQGTYRLENVPPGAATLTVAYTGLDTQQVPVVISSSGPTRQDVGLTAEIYKLSEVVVSGEREGNAQAITLQKLSEGVKSIVSTDAFGNLAGNPADLLVKLPGVEGVYCSDQMRYVKIRGLHQNLTTVTMDGNRLANGASAGANRDFQFQTVNSETVERLEVVKSPTPDMDGDSIGGAVNMVSKSAFDSSGERRVRVLVGATSRMQDPRPKRFPPQFAFSYSEVFKDKLAVSVNYNYRRIYTLSDYSTISYEQLPEGVSGPAYIYSVAATDYREGTTRRGGGIRFDYKLNEHVSFYLNGTENNITEHEFDSYVTFQTNQGVATRDAAGNLTGANGIVPGYTNDRTEVRAVANSNITLRSTAPYKDGVANYLGFGGVHKYETLNIDYNAYLSAAKTNYASQKQLSLINRGVGFVIEASGDAFFPNVRQTAGADWTQLSSYTDNVYTASGSAGWDHFEGISLNVKKDFATRAPTFLKAGYRWREQTRKLQTTPWTGYYVGPDGVKGVNPATGLNDDNLGQFGTQTNRRMATRNVYFPGLPLPDNPSIGSEALEGDGLGSDKLDKVMASNPNYFFRNLATDLQNRLTGHQYFEEDINAYYLMGGIDVAKWSIVGGFRVEQTKVVGVGALTGITAEERARRAAFVGTLTEAEITRRAFAEFGGRQTRDGDYTYFLPGVHLKYTPTRNMVARLSYARNIGRPSIGQLIPRTNVNYEGQTVSSSNPSLKPQTADNYDLGFEYYFEPAGVVSLGFFYKDLKEFIYTAGGATVPTGADNGFGGEYAGYAYTTQYNGGSAIIKGFEINYSQQFTFLPGWMSGLGAYANFTKLRAEGNYGSGGAISLQSTPTIAGFNPTTGNVGLSYIRNNLTLRGQLSYRGRFLNTYNVNASRLSYFKGRSRVDIKTAYQLSRRWELYLDVSNLFPEIGTDRRDTGGRDSNYEYHSPLWSFGVNARL